MNLEDVTVALRPRKHWEAIDLGFSLVRTHWRFVYGPWLVVVIPLFVILNLMFQDRLWLAALVLWWLKPFYDRLVLHVLSRAVFAATPDTVTTLRQLPEIIRSGLLWHLSLMRLDPMRAFNIPVWQLEKLSGKQRRNRQGILQKRTRSHAVWLIITCISLELLVYMGLFALAYMLLPAATDTSFMDLMVKAHDSESLQFASNLSYLLALSVVEPMYVAAGFMLYLNRRTIIEGWDLELTFRRMTARLENMKSTSTAPVMRLGLVFALSTCLVLGTQSSPASAELLSVEDEVLASEIRPAEEAKSTIAEILEQDEFRRREMIEQWRWKSTESNDAPEEPSGDLIQRMVQILATMSEALLWALVITIIVMVVVYRKRWLKLLSTAPKSEPEYEQPNVLFGLDIQPDSLPVDVAAQARLLWTSGKFRQSISLLYRGSLAALLTGKHLQLRTSDTECDVLNRAQPHVRKDTFDYLMQLTRVWQSLAYAHRYPDDEQVLALCDAWPQHFGTPT